MNFEHLIIFSICWTFSSPCPKGRAFFACQSPISHMASWGMWTWQKHPTAVHSLSRNSQLSQGDAEAEMQVKTRSAERVCVQSGAYGTSPPKWHWVKEPRQVSEWFCSRRMSHLLPFLAKIDVEEISDHAFTLTFGLRALGIDGEHRRA